MCFMGIGAAGVMVLDRGDCSRVVHKCLSCMGTDHYERSGCKVDHTVVCQM